MNEYNGLSHIREVVILRGYPGAGKSTYVKNNFKEDTTVVCSADHFFMKNGEYKFDPSKLSEAHAASLRKFIDVINHPTDTPQTLVVDNTNTSVLELSPYLMVAKAYNLKIRLVKLVCKNGYKEAAGRNIHGVPEKTVKRMEETFQTIPGWMLRGGKISEETLET